MQTTQVQNVIEKTSADEYLLEFSNSNIQMWLKLIICEVIKTKAELTEEFINTVYDVFLIENSLAKGTIKDSNVGEISFGTSSILNNFVINEMEHISGVNAIENGSKINFHPKLTVIYGKNGSGKSGFVRILKKIAGSRTEEDIWQNIHNSSVLNNCNVNFKYSVNSIDKSFNWKGNNNYFPFNQMSIFDGKCIPIYLDRNLGFSYQPYGFELFGFISNATLKIQSLLNNEITKRRQSKKDFSNIFNINTSIGNFISNLNQEVTTDRLNSLKIWNNKLETELKNKEEEKASLLTLEKNEEILINRLRMVKVLENILNEAQVELTKDNIDTYLKLIPKLLKIKVNKSKEKKETLYDFNIEGKDSDEWESFIDAGEDYINLVHQHYPSENSKCIYCHQGLSKSSIRLINLYRELFKKTEDSEMEVILEKIDKIVIELKATSFTKQINFSSNDFAKILKKNEFDTCIKILKSSDDVVSKIISSLNQEKVINFKLPKFDKVNKIIDKARLKIETDMKELSKLKTSATTQSIVLSNDIKELTDIKKFTEIKQQILDTILINKFESDANQILKTKVSTLATTNLGKKAWQDLVSDSFRKKFVAEANYLKAPLVNLNFRGEYGNQLRAKNFAGKETLEKYLSEGEQKAVALADFFSELSFQKDSSPVIFDDPANSFDHERKMNIAERIVKESENRQVIVFTHDLFFASYLHSNVESTKNRGELDKSRASFHYIKAESGRVGVMTSDYYPGSVKLEAFIKRIDEMLEYLQTMEDGAEKCHKLKYCYGMLRTAIEKVVEEKIFGSIITRWKDQIQMYNVSKANLRMDKLIRCQELHERFSAFLEGHNQSNEIIDVYTPTYSQITKDFQELKYLYQN